MKKIETCPVCRGKKLLPSRYEKGVTYASPCHECNGTGGIWVDVDEKKAEKGDKKK